MQFPPKPCSRFNRLRSLSPGNNYLPCKHFQKAMESNNSSQQITFRNYNNTYCALDLQFATWFKDVQIVQIDHIRVQKEVRKCNQFPHLITRALAQ